MNQQLIKAQDVILDRINTICSKFGLNNIMAQLYAVLYLSTKPLSLDDMLERLKISKASVSINIRALERYGAVRRVWIKGSRKDFYQAEPNISKVIMDRVKSMAENRLSEIDKMVNDSFAALDSIDQINKGQEKEVALFRQRLEKLKKIHGKAKFAFGFFNNSFLQGVFNGNDKAETLTEETAPKEIAA